jgi:hypothetical protein
MGKKMKGDDPFFATYNVEMSARVYKRNRARKFSSIAVNKSTVEIK